ncbi:hypothetical protein Tco_1388458 [Tanacetum coccineum]
MKFVEQPIGPAPDPVTTDPDTFDKYYESVNLDKYYEPVVTRSHPWAWSNNSPDPSTQPIMYFALTSWRHPWDQNTTAFYKNTHHEQS